MSDQKDDKEDVTDGPGNVSVDEPTEPALSGDETDEFDRQAEEGGAGGAETPQDQ